MAAHAEAPPGPGLSRQRRQSGPRLDADTAEYFRRALETLQEGLSEEELALFVPNVLQELSRVGPSLPRHPRVWGLLERLLPRCPPALLPPLLPPLLRGTPPAHPRGSRLLQAALGGVLALLGEGRGLGEGLGEALGELGAELGRDPGGFARDPNGSFVLRALLAVLAGGGEAVIPPEGAELKAKGAEPKAKKAGPKAKEAWSLPEGAELPPFFRPLLEELAQGLEQEMPKLLTPPCASLCLQGALSALHRSQSPSCARFCRALIGCLAQESPAHDQSPLLTSLQDPARSRLLEAAMTVMDPPQLRELFRGHLRGHLRGVANHRVANHGLQRLLDHAPEDVVQEVLSELGPALGEPLARGHPGVVLALLGAARRHPPLQGEALRCLFQALRCWAPPTHPRCFQALAQLRPLEGGDSGEGAEPEPVPEVSLWGSLAMQELLEFGVPSPLWGSLGSLGAPQLLGLARGAAGSRLWGALLGTGNAPRNGRKRLLRKLQLKTRGAAGSRLWGALLGTGNAPRNGRKRLLRKLQGQWLELAQDRSGSRVLDSAWACSSLSQRGRIAAELAPHLRRLQRSLWGRAVARNLGLELFLRDRGGWERSQRGAGPGGRGLAL